METRADGTIVYSEADLTEDERFALGLVRAITAQELVRDVKAGRRKPATEAEQMLYRTELHWLAYFLQWFAVEFGKPFPGELREWSARYRAGLDALADKGLVAELHKGAVALPGASTAGEFWFPKVLRLDRLKAAPVILKEG